MQRTILSQDRNLLLGYDSNVDVLRTEKLKCQGNIIGFNLLCNDAILGTFDTLSECIDEMSYITQCEYIIHVINGFEDYKECYEN